VLVPCPDTLLSVTAVSSSVSNARNEGPRCLEPVTPAWTPSWV